MPRMHNLLVDPRVEWGVPTVVQEKDPKAAMDLKAAARDQLSQAVIVAADQVAAFILARGVRHIEPKECVCLAPPYDRIFVDVKLPSGLPIGKTFNWKDAGVGVLWVPWEELRSSLKPGRAEKILAKSYPPGDQPKVEPRWGMICVPQIYMLHRTLNLDILYQSTYQGMYLVGPQGEPLGEGAEIAHPLVMDSANYKDHIGGMSWLCGLAALTVTFMHCKRGVVLRDEVPSERLNRKRARDGRPPFIRYKVLEIEGMASEIRRIQQADPKTGIKQAIHSVQGHLVHYDPSRPYMGKPHAEPLVFYHRHHVRGDKKKGMIVKDYDVKPPKGIDMPEAGG